jgi:adenylate kinase
MPPINASPSLIIVLIGPPGAGKGSQAKLLAQSLKLPCLSIGALLREISRRRTLLAQQVRDRLSKGQLMENELLAEVIRNRSSESDCEDGYLIDGYPRNFVQAQWLEQWALLQRKQITAVHLSISNEIARIRVSGRRTCSACGEAFNLYTKPPNLLSKCDSCDATLVSRDDAQIIDQRLAVYESETLPLLDHYSNFGRLVSVNAEPSELDVFRMLVRELRREGLGEHRPYIS